jgi:acyl-[acyl-carrier-protein] desaturase
VLAPVLKTWKVWDRENLGAEGEQAREELAGLLDKLDQAATRFEEKRDSYLARQAARQAG